MDDEEPIRDFVRELLRRLGYDVECSPHGAEAIARYQAALETGRRFDAVILDLTVRGGMGGAETIARLRAIDPGVRALVSSGYSNDPVLADFADYGFSGRVAKPYTAEGLSFALGRLLAGSTGAMAAAEGPATEPT
jgi:CheY-like chemotaxis protein